jgi:DNA-binding CsgD family transcriptional regulator
MDTKTKAKIIDLFSKGHTVEQIADHFGITVEAVNEVLIKWGKK